MGRWFGSDKEEDPLAGLRGNGDSSVSSMGVSGRPGSSGLPPSRPKKPGGRSGVAALIFVVVVLGSFTAMEIYLAGQSDDSGGTTVSTTAPKVPTSTSTETADSDTVSTIVETKARVPATPVSLLGSNGLKRLFAKIKRNVSSQDGVASVRIQSDRADVTVVSKSGTTALTIGPDLSVGSVDAGDARPDAVKLSKLSEAGLNRAIAKVVNRAGTSRSQIDYVVLFAAMPSWSIFLKDKEHTLWKATLDGSEVSQPGGSGQ